MNDNICLWLSIPETLQTLRALAMAGRLAKREEDQDELFRIYDTVKQALKMQGGTDNDKD